MKRIVALLLAVILLFACMLLRIPEASASTKTQESRAIAIVFDNSGSMYMQGNKAWCRATYAMEVFAAMLNDGDILQIYPMWPVTIGGQMYSMENPYQLTDSTKASEIRDIFTPDVSGTPIESIDYAAQGLQNIQADQKYMIVLTDGGTFSKNGTGLTEERTRKELDKRVEQYAGTDMTVMYLGIGSSACMPTIAESVYFVKKQAVNTEDVLSTLTVMCNQIFGRDTLPKKRINGNKIEFDISMSKLIIFVQGENISNLKLTGGNVGNMISTQQTQYSTKGAGDYTSIPDTSLQGMMVTYADCLAGSYTIEYTGTATSVEVYYEPDADLDFVFTDSSGNNVDPNALYEGEYKVSFGIKDARTGKLIESDLLGNPRYDGVYSVDGREVAISHEGFSGSVDVPLKTGETFAAKMMVTYLSGYTITKSSSDFGWPEGGIPVVARFAPELRLEISGGAPVYSLQYLEEGTPFIAKVYDKDTLITGDELERVELKWDPDTSHAEIKQQFAGDHYILTMHYKDPAAPQNTVCGECTVAIHAFYSAKGSSEAHAECPLTYNIKNDSVLLQMRLYAPESYIVINELENSQAIVVTPKINGAAPTAEQFAAMNLQVDCGGIKHTVSAKEQDKTYSIKLRDSGGIAEGDYPIKVKLLYTDSIGRTTEIEDSVSLTLSHIPLWVRWTLSLLALLALAIILWIILHIKVLPKHANTNKKLSSMNYDGDDVTPSSNFLAEIKKKGAKVQAQYGGKKFGITMDVKPGRESYLYKSQKRRSAEVRIASVKKFGAAKIQEAMIGSAKYVADETTGKLIPAIPNQKPFTLTNGTTVRYSGTISDAGIDKDFEVTSKLNFKKKK